MNTLPSLDSTMPRALYRQKHMATARALSQYSPGKPYITYLGEHFDIDEPEKPHR